jgi:hypothetical protein
LARAYTVARPIHGTVARLIHSGPANTRYARANTLANTPIPCIGPARDGRAPGLDGRDVIRQRRDLDVASTPTRRHFDQDVMLMARRAGTYWQASHSGGLAHTLGHKHTHTLGHKHTHTLGHKHAHTGTQARAHTGTQARAHTGTQAHAHTGAQAHAHTGTQAHAHTGTQAHAHTGTQARAHTGTQARAHTGTQARAHTGTQAHAHTGTQAHAHTGTQGMPMARRAGTHRPVSLPPRTSPGHEPRKDLFAFESSAFRSPSTGQ